MTMSKAQYAHYLARKDKPVCKVRISRTVTALLIARKRAQRYRKAQAGQAVAREAHTARREALTRTRKRVAFEDIRETVASYRREGHIMVTVDRLLETLLLMPRYTNLDYEKTRERLVTYLKRRTFLFAGIMVLSERVSRDLRVLTRKEFKASLYMLLLLDKRVLPKLRGRFNEDELQEGQYRLMLDLQKGKLSKKVEGLPARDMVKLIAHILKGYALSYRRDQTKGQGAPTSLHITIGEDTTLLEVLADTRDTYKHIETRSVLEHFQSTLTERQANVLQLYAEGYGTGQVADKLGVSKRTVNRERSVLQERATACGFHG